MSGSLLQRELNQLAFNQPEWSQFYVRLLNTVSGLGFAGRDCNARQDWREALECGCIWRQREVSEFRGFDEFLRTSVSFNWRPCGIGVLAFILLFSS